MISSAHKQKHSAKFLLLWGSATLGNKHSCSRLPHTNRNMVFFLTIVEELCSWTEEPRYILHQPLTTYSTAVHNFPYEWWEDTTTGLPWRIMGVPCFGWLPCGVCPELLHKCYSWMAFEIPNYFKQIYFIISLWSNVNIFLPVFISFTILKQSKCLNAQQFSDILITE